MGASTALELSAASNESRSGPKTVLSISKDDLIPKEDRNDSKEDKAYNDFYISLMYYNSHRDELFYVDNADYQTVRSIRFHVAPAVDNRRGLVNVYKNSSLLHPVHYMEYMRDTDTLLLLLSGSKHLVVLTRSGEGRSNDEWREANRLLIKEGYYKICCALSDSRVLFGRPDLDYMELFRVESGPRITHVHRIYLPESYSNFVATGAGETLVAMAYKESVSVNHLCGDHLKEISRIQSSDCCNVLSLGDRLLVSESNASTNSHVIVELVLNGTILERRRELDLTRAHTELECWCAVGNELAIYDSNSQQLVLYSFD